MEKVCEYCGSTFKGNEATRFCSRKCMPSRHNPTLIEVRCPQCHQLRLVKLRGYKGKNVKCRNCTSDSQSGSSSPNWRGGHKHWSSGRFGKDKDGLSWKTQRRLAWERDDYVCQHCQHCHEKKNRKPDVHHIVPWMSSHSHALGNLICLCQSCHLKEEAKIQEKWGGTILASKYFICTCGKRCVNEQCSECKRKAKKQKQPRKIGPYSKASEEARKLRSAIEREKKERLLPLVLQFRADGLSLAQIAGRLPIKLHRQTIYHWLKWGSTHKPQKP